MVTEPIFINTSNLPFFNAKESFKLHKSKKKNDLGWKEWSQILLSKK